jgi:hypothetical protein
MYHIPVLLNESVDALNIKPDGTYVDVTFGGGGHSRHIMEFLGDKGRLFAFDQDEDAAKNVIDDSRFTFIQQNFRYMKNFLQLYCGGKVDGIIADLGVSSYQFDTPEKGFSINKKPHCKSAVLMQIYHPDRCARQMAPSMRSLSLGSFFSCSSRNSFTSCLLEVPSMGHLLLITVRFARRTAFAISCSGAKSRGRIIVIWLSESSVTGEKQPRLPFCRFITKVSRASSIW